MASQPRRGGALVTGGVRRIGRAIAERLAQQGYSVAIHASARSRAEAERFVGDLLARGLRASVVCGDLGDPPQVARTIEDARAAVGALELLVNNASVFERDAVEDFEAVALDRHMAVNLRAPIQLASLFASSLPAGRSGCVINVIDQRVWRLTADFFSYTLSKSALWTATQTMALAFAPRIRVNAVGPGPTLPNEMEGEEGFAEEIAATPLHCAVPLEAVCQAVLYLADATSVTGQMIAVDAGQHLGPAAPIRPRSREAGEG